MGSFKLLLVVLFFFSAFSLAQETVFTGDKQEPHST